MRPTCEIANPSWSDVVDRDKEMARLREALQLIADRGGTEAVEDGQVVEFAGEWAAYVAKETLKKNQLDKLENQQQTKENK